MQHLRGLRRVRVLQPRLSIHCHVVGRQKAERRTKVVIVVITIVVAARQAASVAQEKATAAAAAAAAAAAVVLIATAGTERARAQVTEQVVERLQKVKMLDRITGKIN